MSFPSQMSRRQWRQHETVPADSAPEVPPFLMTEPAGADAAAPVATILTVCTGNICRSPMGEVLLRARLAPLGVRVHSGGTHALVGHEMTDQAQQLAVALGSTQADAAAHRARYLVEPMLRESDLILAMAREHRSHSVQMVPAVLKRTFTVREFARLSAGLTDADARQAADAAGDDPGARLQAVARAVAEQRGLAVRAAAEDDDVIDPYRRSQRTYELSASQLTPAIDEVERIVTAALR